MASQRTNQRDDMAADLERLDVGQEAAFGGSMTRRVPKGPGMTLEEIKAAVDNGDTVHWKNSGYRVVRGHHGQYLIVFERNGNAIGLTWQDGITLNGEPKDFYVAGERAENPLKQARPAGSVVMFTPNPASIMLYGPEGRANLPRDGEYGVVTPISGSTFMRGPGGGLLYVKWDDGRHVGVSLHDVTAAGDDKHRHMRAAKLAQRYMQGEAIDRCVVAWREGRPCHDRPAINSVTTRLATSFQVHDHRESRVARRHLAPKSGPPEVLRALLEVAGDDLANDETWRRSGPPVGRVPHPHAELPLQGGAVSPELARGGKRKSNPAAGESMTVDDFRKLIHAEGPQDRRVMTRFSGMGTRPNQGVVFINFCNVPQGDDIDGATYENNRASFQISGLPTTRFIGGQQVSVLDMTSGGDGRALMPEKVSIEMMTSVFPREFKLRKKTGTPTAIAKYVGDFMKSIAATVPPKLHERRGNPVQVPDGTPPPTEVGMGPAIVWSKDSYGNLVAVIPEGRIWIGPGRSGKFEGELTIISDGKALRGVYVRPSSTLSGIISQIKKELREVRLLAEPIGT